jgi:phosphoribosylamine---glycine ligase
MKIAVVGNGGRENALAWKLLQSPNVEKVFCIPGNGGTALMERCENIPYGVEDFAQIANLIEKNNISLVVVGPELPLSKGITDYLQKRNITVFGPSEEGAKIESSKSWAKTLMNEAGIPTAQGETFTEAIAAKTYIDQQGAPIVIKADGLAAGKGVVVAQTIEEAKTAIDELFASGFNLVVVEECLLGEEVSVLALTDGISIRMLLPAQDHKRIGEGDQGNNTGGMGAYAPAPIATPEILEKIETQILQPTVEALRKKGIDYCGVLYAGLMITPQGEAKILEYNCRFGDPETQAILPLLETPLEELLLACAEKRLGDFPPLQWKQGGSVCVVIAANGYPASYEKGKVITGLDKASQSGAIAFHGGTILDDNQVLTNGGRVLGITATGEDFSQALTNVYQAVDLINFDNMYFRRDIAWRLKL